MQEVVKKTPKAQQIYKVYFDRPVGPSKETNWITKFRLRWRGSSGPHNQNHKLTLFDEGPFREVSRMDTTIVIWMGGKQEECQGKG